MSCHPGSGEHEPLIKCENLAFIISGTDSLAYQNDAAFSGNDNSLLGVKDDNSRPASHFSHCIRTRSDQQGQKQFAFASRGDGTTDDFDIFERHGWITYSAEFTANDAWFKNNSFRNPAVRFRATHGINNLQACS